MQPQTKKKVIIGGIAVVILGGIAWYVWKKHKEEKNKSSITVTGDNPVVPTTASNSPNASQGQTTALATSGPKTKAAAKGPIKSPVDSPINPKPISADSLIGSKGVNAIIGKTLIAKSNGAGIYTTSNQKVSVTNAGEKLGKAFLATRMAAGNYLIKYQDSAGNYRVVASSSINVI